MIQAILTLPKVILVAIILIGGVLLLVLFDPPHTICDTQRDNFQESQKTFLFEGSRIIKSQKAPPDYVDLNEVCVTRNSPGACFEYFHKLKEMLRDLDFASEECRESVGDIKQVKKAVWENIKLMADIAWGASPPTSSSFKLGWFTPADLNLYCDLKRVAQTFYPATTWENFREKTLKDMPGAESLSREQMWGLSLLSIRCDRYL